MWLFPPKGNFSVFHSLDQLQMICHSEAAKQDTIFLPIAAQQQQQTFQLFLRYLTSLPHQSRWVLMLQYTNRNKNSSTSEEKNLHLKTTTTFDHLLNGGIQVRLHIVHPNNPSLFSHHSSSQSKDLKPNWISPTSCFVAPHIESIAVSLFVDFLVEFDKYILRCKSK